MSPIRAPAVVGLACVAVGIGLDRFAWAPLSAVLVDAGALSSVEATRVGAANLAGYALGALIAARLGGARPFRWMRIALAASALLLLLEAAPLPWPAAATVRGALGLLGALLMVLAPAALLQGVSGDQRARTSGLIFTGVGVGAVASALMVAGAAWLSPHLPQMLLAALALGALALAGQRSARAPGPSVSAVPTTPPSSRSAPPGLWPLCLAYLLDAIGYLPHTVSLSDYVAHELHLGPTRGALTFAALGLGAIPGALSAAWLARRLGLRHALMACYGLKSLGIALAVAWPAQSLLMISAALVGAMIPAIVTLTALSIAQQTPPALLARRWGFATAIFALGQAGGGALLSLGYAELGAYRPLFWLGAGLLALGGGVISAGRPAPSPGWRSPAPDPPAPTRSR